MDEEQRVNALQKEFDELRALNTAILDEVSEREAALEEAGGERRGLTASEKATLNQNRARIEVITSELRAIDDRLQAGIGLRPIGGHRTHSAPTVQGRHGKRFRVYGYDRKTGRPVIALGRGEKFADLVDVNGPDPADLSLGRYIVGLMRGDMSGCQAEVGAMSTVSNPGGGFLVPNPLSAGVIDLARANSVAMEAGGQVIPMASSTLDIARVSEDATYEAKSEDASFTGSSVTFDKLTLTAHTCGTVVTLSRELAEDAVNGAKAIDDALARGLAAQIDKWALRGTGSQEPQGILLFAGNTSAVSGSIDWDNLLDAIELLEADNHDANAYVLSPANKKVLAALKVNSEANHFASPPPDVAALSKFVTSAMPDTDAIVGDFSKLIIGLRQEARLEYSTDADEAFDRHQMKIKIVWRGDFNCEDSNAFCSLTAIS
jgi:HK97 family phage major capsid protein